MDEVGSTPDQVPEERLVIREPRPVARWIGSSTRLGSASSAMRNAVEDAGGTDDAVVAGSDAEVVAVVVDVADVVDMA